MTDSQNSDSSKSESPSLRIETKQKQIIKILPAKDLQITNSNRE